MGPRPLHPNAIHVNLTNSHAYGPFFALDNVLSHMDDPNWGIKNANTLDQLGHDIHMHLLWQAASGKYHDMVANSPPTSETCDCLINSYNATIYHDLGIMAVEIRTPEQMPQGWEDQGDEKAKVRRCCGCTRPPKKNKKGSYGGRSIAAPGTSNPANQMTYISIVDEQSWEDWKVAMDSSASFEQDMANHLAAYLYCKLNL